MLDIKLLMALRVREIAAKAPPEPLDCPLEAGVELLYCVDCGCWKLRCDSALFAAPNVSVVAAYRTSCLRSDEETLPNTLRPVFSSGEIPRLVRMNPPVPTATPAATVALPMSGLFPFA